MKILNFVGILGIMFIIDAVNGSVYRFCVPKIWFDDCQEMVQNIPDIKCVPARDRVECLNFIQQRHADFSAVEPEDMYLARNIPNGDFYVFQEMRTILEPTAEYRYEAIMLVRNSLKINSLEGLRGLKTCHTGINRNVGYKIPLTMLMKRNIIGPMNDLSLSPKENELKALSQMFNKSCIVGKWSANPEINTRLKSKYSNLCAMCEHPEKCDYPDNFSGYDGSIRCLVHNNGDVAFTKIIYVRMFFGLPVGPHPAKDTGENPRDYSYLCGDGSKTPVIGRGCSWAARPWQGFISHPDIIDNVDPLRNRLRELADKGLQTNSTWFYRVLTLDDEVHSLYDNTPIAPGDYLDKANYTYVIERGHGEPEPTVRVCVTSDVALLKCQVISTTAFSRDIRPKLVCVEGNDEKQCIQMVKDDLADATYVSGTRVYSTMKNSALKPLFSEVYADKKNLTAVAVVKKDSSYNSWNDVYNRGLWFCHKRDSVEGKIAPIYSLKQQGTLKKDECAKGKLKFYVMNSCEDGQCEVDPVKCLYRDHGVIAFVTNVDALSLNSSEYELLCLNKGGRAPIDQWETCNLMTIPPVTWMGDVSRFSRPTDSISHLMFSLLDLLTQWRPELLDLFGEFLDHKNIIFSSSTTGLIDSYEKWFEDFEEIRKSVKC